MIYQDRREAGRVLAQAVADAHLPDIANAIVLGLVRGGVPVAFEVATALGLPLDVMIVRKVGAPGNREFAMGAVASAGANAAAGAVAAVAAGAVVLNPEVVRGFGVPEEKLRQLIDEQKHEIERLENLYREGRPPVEFGHGGVILVDDGLATGASMRAAVRAVRPRAKLVTIAVPVAARSTCVELGKEVDHVVCPMMPEPLEAVSLFYREFGPTSDDEVRALLAEATGRQRTGVREQRSETRG